MNYHAVGFASLITLLSIFSSCYGQQNPEGAPEAATGLPEIQKPGKVETVNDSPEVQKPSASESTNDGAKVQKPSEAEAMEAAVMYLNRDGQLTIQETEFIAWGTFSEQQVYWPMKFRMTYKSRGSDSLRQNEYAVKISRDLNGKLKAATYYAWRTDFK